MRWAQEDFQRKVLHVALPIKIPGVAGMFFNYDNNNAARKMLQNSVWG